VNVTFTQKVIMSALAQKVNRSLNKLEQIKSLGAISGELEKQIATAMDRSRTGRLFGHSSAIELPSELLETLTVCSNFIENEDDALKVKNIFANKFENKRARRPTTINLVLKEVKKEILHAQPSVVPLKAETKNGFVQKLITFFGF